MSSPPASASSEQPVAAVEPPDLAPDEHGVSIWARRLALERVRMEASEAQADAITDVPGVDTRLYLAELLDAIRKDPPPPPRMTVGADLLLDRVAAALHAPRRLARVLACADVSPNFRRDVEAIGTEVRRRGRVPTPRLRVPHLRGRGAARRPRCTRRAGASSRTASADPGGDDAGDDGEHHRHVEDQRRLDRLTREVGGAG
jgi:hypothetical protein